MWRLNGCTLKVVRRYLAWSSYHHNSILDKVWVGSIFWTFFRYILNLFSLQACYNGFLFAHANIVITDCNIELLQYQKTRFLSFQKQNTVQSLITLKLIEDKQKVLCKNSQSGFKNIFEEYPNHLVLHRIEKQVSYHNAHILSPIALM